jgi:hypothetical protein
MKVDAEEKKKVKKVGQGKTVIMRNTFNSKSVQMTCKHC